jgi:putative ABC transport system ATP-binding protein
MFRALLKDLGLGLEERLGARVGTLSGGQRQALTLLLATLRTPRLLLLDEHVAALDPRTTPIVLELTRRLVEHQDQHITTLMVTHNVEHALTFGNRLLMLHAGRIVLDVAGQEKQALSVRELIARYEDQAHARLSDDRVLLRDR